MSEYEQHALREIHAWKNPEIGWFGQAMKLIDWSLDRAGDLILSCPGLGDAIRNSLMGLCGICNDLAPWSVQREAIYEEFRKEGHPEIKKPADVFTIDLEHVDRIGAWLDMKYTGIALVEGAGAGDIGLLGIPPDIVALIALTPTGSGIVRRV
jgi:hypothetical protein